MILDAATLARGWLSAFTATSNEPARPQLHKTIFIEQHTHGVRLVATDSYMLLHTWIPERDYEFDPEPEPEEIPYATAVAIDAHGRGVGLLSHLLKLTKEKDGELKQLDVTVRLNVEWEPDEPDQTIRLEGFTALAVVIEHPDHERVQLEVYQGNYPTWQAVLAGVKRSRTEAIGLSAWTAGRLAKAAKVHGDETTIRHYFGGKDKPVSVSFGEEPEVSGLVMPVKWNMDTNEPWVEPVQTETED